MAKKTFPLVEIEWLDITDFSGWNDLEDKDDFSPTVCYSVGYLIHKDKKMVQITETISPGESEECFGLIKCLPIGCVVSIKKLKN